MVSYYFEKGVTSGGNNFNNMVQIQDKVLFHFVLVPSGKAWILQIWFVWNNKKKIWILDQRDDETDNSDHFSV